MRSESPAVGRVVVAVPVCEVVVQVGWKFTSVEFFSVLSLTPLKFIPPLSSSESIATQSFSKSKIRRQFRLPESQEFSTKFLAPFPSVRARA